MKPSNKPYSRKLEKLIRETLPRSERAEAIQVVSCAPGWKVVIKYDPAPGEGTPGMLIARDICCWLLDRGQLEPCFFDMIAPVVARTSGRVVAIIDPARREMLTNGIEESVDLKGQENELFEASDA